MTTRTRISVAVALACFVAVTASAQRGRFGGVPEGPWVPPRFPTPTFHDGRFTHCKIMYESVRREMNGMGWATDYPYAAINLLTRVKELTKTPISLDAQGDPNYWVVRLTDDALFSCPFTMATDVGTAGFSDEEILRLREYLLKGGFLWVDDFWGDRAWDQWTSQLKRAMPEYAIEDVPPDRPLMHTMFDSRTRRRSRASTSGGVAVAPPPSAAPRARRPTCA